MLRTPAPLLAHLEIDFSPKLANKDSDVRQQRCTMLFTKITAAVSEG
ncbi:hypothetical protein [Paenibacillus planticolens]|nr:hypothetical protein [Paenibacillus planticolens]